MANDSTHIEEHELPSIEAALACTLALMTGYSQALQAEVHPEQRLAMGEKVAFHLVLLTEHPLLSPGFRQVLVGLQARWHAMGTCTREAARDCTGREGSPGSGRFGAEPHDRRPPGPKQLH